MVGSTTEPVAKQVKHVRLYDFRQPDTLDRSQIKALHLFFDVLAHRIASTLMGSLGVAVHVLLDDLQQISWEEYGKSLPEPACLVSTGLLPLPGKAILHLPISLAMTIVDLRLGGNGTGEFPDRALTEIESRVVQLVAEDIFAEFPPVFAPLMPLRPASALLVSSIEFLQTMRPTEMCLLVNMNCRLGEGDQVSFSFCLPHTTIRPLVEAAVKAESPSGEVDKESSAPLVAERLEEVPVEVSVCFPPVTLTSAEVLGLVPGDIIWLHYDQEKPLSMIVGGHEYLKVFPSSVGKRLACVIADEKEVP
ncbi:MAG: flagellar motor switch protein FliM [Actinobacteria bacterium]|nr:flagellar motor switch protein FliM [Actinomycetota bacterium]MCL6094624.1 flagellar motor switch protein FliM [Actinomycetota bacterium]